MNHVKEVISGIKGDIFRCNPKNEVRIEKVMTSEDEDAH